MRPVDPEKLLIVLFVAGTCTVRNIFGSVWACMCERRGGRAPTHVVPITLACEPACELGLTGTLAARHIEMVDDDALYELMMDSSGEMPWVDRIGMLAIEERAGDTGTGNSALPGKGRTRLVGSAEEVYLQLCAAQVRAKAERRRKLFVVLSQLHSGTSRGALIQPPIFAQRALGGRVECRLISVDPFEPGRNEEGWAQAANARSAHGILERGMDATQVWDDNSPEGDGKHRGMLYTSVIPVAATLPKAPGATVDAFHRLEDLHVAAARLLEGTLEHTAAYRMFADDMNNGQRQMGAIDIGGERRSRRYHALGESRVYDDRARLEALARWRLVEELRRGWGQDA